MTQVVRGTGNILFVGWMLIGMGAVAVVVLTVLSFTVAHWIVFFLLAPLLMLVGGGINLRMGYRARLEVRPDRFIWCGTVGREFTVFWRDVWQIVLPAPGSRPRLAALAQMRDGSAVEIEALWFPQASLGAVLSPPDHSRAQQALIDGHRAYLAGTATGTDPR